MVAAEGRDLSLRELTERGELFRLHEPVLRAAQVVERGGELLRARLHLVEQANVFESNDGLIGESLDDLNLPVGKMPRLRSCQHKRALDAVFLQQRNAQQRARGIAKRRHRHDVFRILTTIWNALDLAR